MRLLVPRHGGVPDGGAADAYGASNGRDLWRRRAAAAPSTAPAPAPPAAAPAAAAALEVPACTRPGSARLCAFGSGDMVGDASAGPPRGPARRRAPAGVAAQAALLAAQALPQDCAVYALTASSSGYPSSSPRPRGARILTGELSQENANKCISRRACHESWSQPQNSPGTETSVTFPQKVLTWRLGLSAYISDSLLRNLVRGSL